jgi:DNA-binding response OmpR family regulator
MVLYEKKRCQCGQCTKNMKPVKFSSTRNRGRKRVLLADDDRVVRDSLAAVLEAEGYAVVPAEDGQQALEFVSTTPIDLVLLDLNMPRKGGWDTFERLSAEHPLVPVIVITARPNQLFTAVNAGVGALLEKPLDIPMLLGTIRRLLAEPAETRLQRLAGRSTHFYFIAGRDDSPDKPPHS